MLFSTPIFLFAFLPFTLIGYYLLHGRYRNFFLTVCSLFFYAWGEPTFVLVMIGSILLNWLFALWVDYEKRKNRKPKIVIFLTVAANLSIMFIFKYLMFALTNINSVFGTSINVPNITLPIGISFFTFQAISYVIDVYRKKGDVQKNPLNVAFYIAFFPQLIAGPIVRYETVAREIKDRRFNLDDFSAGVKRFIVGLAKKVILANTVAVIADRTFNSGDISNLSVLMAWLGVICYTFQIFFDFSGYSDMAIGLGLMFGFHFLENFDYPYVSRSITEFWRRWHISLGTWFRDYVYFPLGGSRVKTKWRLVFNLFVVWLLTGIWHGASWNFIIWGLMYFVLIAAEKIITLRNAEKQIKKNNPILNIFKHIYTMLFVILGWVLFRAADLSGAVQYMGSMFKLNGNALVDDSSLFIAGDSLVVLLVCVFASIPIARIINNRLKNKKSYQIAVQISLVALFIMSISFLTTSSYNPFIYFNF